MYKKRKVYVLLILMSLAIIVLAGYNKKARAGKLEAEEHPSDYNQANANNKSMAEGKSGSVRKILVIGPTAGRGSGKSKMAGVPAFSSRLSQYTSPDTEVHVVRIEKGPTSIETFYDEAFSVPEVLKLVDKFKTEYDAMVISCCADPGLHASRELADIPILGPMETSMHVAALLGHKFAVITIPKNAGPWTEMQVREAGLEDKLACAIGIDLPIREIHADETGTTVIEEIVKEGQKAIREYGAEVIVLGCTGFGGKIAETVEARLGVPVVEPSRTSLAIADALARIGLKNSRSCLYMRRPDPKKIVGYD